MSAQPTYCRVNAAATYYCGTGTTVYQQGVRVVTVGAPLSGSYRCQASQAGFSDWTNPGYYDGGSNTCTYVAVFVPSDDCQVGDPLCWTTDWYAVPSPGSNCCP